MASPFALAAQRLGALLALLGVIFGAFGAHALKLEPPQSEWWHTAVEYQFIHALAMLAIGQGTVARIVPVAFWLSGVFLFSGSLYLLALDPSLKSWIWPATPLGGLSLIVGWGCLLFDLRHRKNP
jgi:uncharacterized membrane protein YgdD (TMEM256/DUF423 family)